MIKNDPNDIKKIDSKLYGIYRGVVEDNDDTTIPDNNMEYKGTGRCRIRVWGIHTKKKSKSAIEGIPTNELPWAQPANSIIGGSITGIGLWSVPVKGSHVFVFFENGDHMQPRYFATVPGINHINSSGSGYIDIGLESSDGFQDPDGVYPDKSLCVGRANKKEPDMNRLARGDIKDTCIEAIRAKKITDDLECEPDIGYEPIYPHDMVLQTHGGHVIELDSTPSKERMLVYHPSNTFMEINKDGRLLIKSVNGRYDIVIGNRIICVKGNDTHTINGSRSEDVTGAWSMDSGGGMSLSDPSIITICSGGVVYVGSYVVLGSCGDDQALPLANSSHTHSCAFKYDPLDPAISTCTCSPPVNGLTTNALAV